MSFEPGDRVRVLTTDKWGGRTGMVTPTKPLGFEYSVLLDGPKPVTVGFHKNELEHVVPTPTLKQAKANLKKAEADLESAQAALLKARTVLSRVQASQPVEPPVGSDVRFDVQYQHHAEPYTYLALRQREGWTISGDRQRGKVYTWAELLEMADRGVNERKLDIRTAP